jgi:hypothetical protein
MIAMVCRGPAFVIQEQRRINASFGTPFRDIGHACTENPESAMAPSYLTN